MICQHAHGEHNDEFARCADCGQEWTCIGGVWFEVLLWCRVSENLLITPDATRTEQERGAR
jgi:hypothetical protein